MNKLKSLCGRVVAAQNVIWAVGGVTSFAIINVFGVIGLIMVTS